MKPGSARPKTHHSKIPYRCTECNKLFKDAHLLYSHLEHHITRDGPNCTVCGVIFHDTPSLEKHLRRHPAVSSCLNNCSDILRCSLCPKVFYTGTGLRIHVLKVHAKQEILSCTVCKKEFVSPQSLHEHVWSHVSEKNELYEEDTVLERTNSKASLKSDLSEILDLASLKNLGQDSQNQSNIVGLRDKISALCQDLTTERGMESKMQEKLSYVLEALLCMEPYKLKESLNRAAVLDDCESPLSSLQEQRLFRCSVCQMSFETPVSLINHVRTHTIKEKCIVDTVIKKPVEELLVRTRNFICGLCPKTFRSRSSMYHHIKSHRDKPNIPHLMKKMPDFSPPEAEKMQINPKKSRGQHHVMSERDRTPKLSEEEMENFPSNDSRKEKHFNCHVCERKFYKLHGLQIHMARTHSAPIKKIIVKQCLRAKKWTVSKGFENRPFMCSLCPWRFKNTSHLTDHIISVHHRKRFPCSKCDQVFNLPRNLKRHVYLEHFES